MKGLPMIDQRNYLVERLKLWLMRKNSNYLCLDEKPERPPQGAVAAARVEYKHDLTAWLERMDTCVSST